MNTRRECGERLSIALGFFNISINSELTTDGWKMRTSQKVVDICCLPSTPLSPLLALYSRFSAFPQPRSGHMTQTRPMEPSQKRSFEWKDAESFLQLTHSGMAWTLWQLVPATKLPGASKSLWLRNRVQQLSLQFCYPPQILPHIPILPKLGRAGVLLPL